MGAYLSEPVTRKDSCEGENERLKYGGSSMQGWRTGMEDAHTADLDIEKNGQTAFFGVFDGHGGREVALFCARHLHNVFRNTQQFAQGDMEQALITSFLEMDTRIRTKEGQRELARFAENSGASDNEDEGDSQVEYTERNAGCTSVVAVVRGRTLYVANAGDSRCVLCRSGQAVDMSVDHKPTQEEERNRILKAGGFISDGRVNGCLALSRAIGDLEFKRSYELAPEEQVVTAYPEVRKLELSREDDFLILACDGIWDVLSSQACVDFVKQKLAAGVPLKAVCEALCDRCMAQDTRGSGIGCDNMTVVIVKIKPARAADGGRRGGPSPGGSLARVEGNRHWFLLPNLLRLTPPLSAALPPQTVMEGA